jgi:hypothetical protein
MKPSPVYPDGEHGGHGEQRTTEFCSTSDRRECHHTVHQTLEWPRLELMSARTALNKDVIMRHVSGRRHQPTPPPHPLQQRIG